MIRAQERLTAFSSAPRRDALAGTAEADDILPHRTNTVDLRVLVVVPRNQLAHSDVVLRTVLR